MTLYDYPDCPFAKKVRIVLAEKDLEFDTVIIDLTQAQQQSEEFLRISPFGKVPVLIDEDCVIYESSIINEYLNDEYPHPPDLLPEDSAQRARVRLLVDFAERALTLPAMAIDREIRSATRDEGRISAAREVIGKTLAMLERELDGREFLAGDFSLADAAFAPSLIDLASLGVSVEDSLPNVKAWIQRLTERPSVGSVAKLVA